MASYSFLAVADLYFISFLISLLKFNFILESTVLDERNKTSTEIENHFRPLPMEIYSETDKIGQSSVI